LDAASQAPKSVDCWGFLPPIEARPGADAVNVSAEATPMWLLPRAQFSGQIRWRAR
jgi:hypothetical protein